MNNIKIQQFEGRKGPVKNQFIIEDRENNKTIFQSYNSIIAIKDNTTGKIELGSDWDYSTTTAKYRNQFLNMNKSEIEKAIKAGDITINPNL